MREEMTPEDTPTCGKGLAEHSHVPAALAHLTGSVADVLEHHTRALDPTDERSGMELVAYRRLVAAHRRIAADLRATAEEMASYRTLPMGSHDPAVMMAPEARRVFATFIHNEEALYALLGDRLDRDRGMLEQMGGAPD